MGTVTVDIASILNLLIVVGLGVTGFFLRDIYRDFKALREQVVGIDRNMAVLTERVENIETAKE